MTASEVFHALVENLIPHVPTNTEREPANRLPFQKVEGRLGDCGDFHTHVNNNLWMQTQADTMRANALDGRRNDDVMTIDRGIGLAA